VVAARDFPGNSSSGFFYLIEKTSEFKISQDWHGRCLYYCRQSGDKPILRAYTTITTKTCEASEFALHEKIAGENPVQGYQQGNPSVTGKPGYLHYGSPVVN
jgi:hypothetical protein